MTSALWAGIMTSTDGVEFEIGERGDVEGMDADDEEEIVALSAHQRVVGTSVVESFLIFLVGGG